VDKSSNPSERFLARGLKRRSSPLDPFWEWLQHSLAILVRIVVVAAIGWALYTYIAVCVATKCDGTDCSSKGAESTGKPSKALANSSKAGASDLQYVWVQLMPDEKSGTPGGRLVRTIGPKGGNCPTITQGRELLEMDSRPPSVRAAFPILLCERELIDNSEARIGSIKLPARPDEPNDIVVIGDTGCRMVYWQIQPCRVADGWPFARVADSAHKQVREKSFILHVGDFHYREDPCIDSSTDCGKSPFGDNWDTWRAEFFEPASKLLLAAPWVIMRGNHEDCARAGAGWIFLFGLRGQYETASACDNKAQMYELNIGTTEEDPSRRRTLVVLDTSDEKNEHNYKANCRRYEELWTQIGALKSDSEIWLALHQPLWGRVMKGEPKQGTKKDDDDAGGCVNDTKADNGKEDSPLAVFRDKFAMDKDKRLARLVLAGDTHAFQFFWPLAGSTPIQIIAGNGGTKLDKLYKKAADGKDVLDKDMPDVLKVTSGGIEGQNLTLVQFGFTVMRRRDTTWSATQFDREGEIMAVCQFSEASTPPPDLPNCKDIRSKDAPSN
jgi:hypothetical protein